MFQNITPLVLAFAFGAFIVLLTLIKSGHFVRYLTLSAISGIGALFAVNLLTSITGVSIALNYITLAVSSLFGISGVIALVLIN